MTTLVTRELYCTLTEEDKRMRSQELVALLEREDGLKAQAKLASQAFKARAEEVEAARKDIQRALRDSKELRPVDVEERHNYVRRVVEIVRMDTFAVIESRAMRPNELQEVLPIESFQPFSKEDAKRARAKKRKKGSTVRSEKEGVHGAE